MKKLKELFHIFEKPVIVLVSAASITALLFNLEFNLFEAKLYDFRVSFGEQQEPNPNIVVITVDDKTTEALNEFAPLPLQHHTRFLEKLRDYNPRGIGYLVNMNFVNQSAPEEFKEDWGRRFVKTAKTFSQSGTPLVIGTPFDINGEIIPPYPLSALDHSIAVIHKDGNVFSEDKVTRRALTYLYGKPTFHLSFAHSLNLIPDNYRPRGSFYVPQVDGEYLFFRYHGAPADLPYRHFSFIDVVEGRVAPHELQDKIILVGSMSKENPSDFALTPYSNEPYTHPKIFIHATILDSIIENDGITLAPQWLNWSTTFLVVCFVLWWIINATPLYGVFATFGLTFSFLLFAHLLFQGIGSVNGVWIRESQPLVGIFLGYYLAVPYRLIREYKKRWEYQRKNTILVQVEELKTNFLSLITHDLKTPVARIQGLAEILQRKKENPLDPQDKVTVDHIIASSEELNHFISSILELTKIDSNRVRLQLESKDVNHILENSIERFQPHAQAKNIRIKTQLEPLFPIKLDPSLILKVLNNLIDNAIKYSPENSEIFVSSDEVGDFVEIKIKDQGIGMNPEELDHLFTRFYRAKNDSTTKITGTGLGLYLTKYFIEAHQGHVHVESSPGEGSEFTVKIPLEVKPVTQIKKARKKKEDHFRPGLTRKFVRSFLKNFGIPSKKENKNV